MLEGMAAAAANGLKVGSDSRLSLRVEGGGSEGEIKPPRPVPKPGAVESKSSIDFGSQPGEIPVRKFKPGSKLPPLPLPGSRLSMN